MVKCTFQQSSRRWNLRDWLALNYLQVSCNVTRVSFSVGVSVVLGQSHFTDEHQHEFDVIRTQSYCFAAGSVIVLWLCLLFVCLLKSCLALCTTGSVLASLFVPLPFAVLATWICSLSPCPLSGPLPPSISALCICRYLSPRSIHSILPSVWGHAAHIWRPRLPAQSLFLFLYLLPNPAAQHSPASLHALIVCVLAPPPRPVPDPARPHPVSPPQSLSSHTHLAPSSTPTQRPVLLSTHSLWHAFSLGFPPPLSSLTFFSPSPASTVIPLSLHHLLLSLCFLRFCLHCCDCFCDPLLFSGNLVLTSSIHSALFAPPAPSSARQQLRHCREHVEDSEHAWHQHHLPAPQLPTSIGLGSGGHKGKWGLGGRQVTIGGMCLRGQKRDC